MSSVLLADVKALGKIDYATSDDLLTKLITQAESFVEEYCKIKVTSDEYEQRCEGGNESLWVDMLPITAVATVKDTFDSDEEVDDIFFTETQVRIEQNVNFGEGEYRYKVNYTAGYTAATLPEGIKTAIMQLTLRAYDNTEGKRKQSAAGYGTDWADLLDSDISAVLDRFSLYRYVE